MEVHAEIVRLELAETFVISRESQDWADVVHVSLAHDGVVGRGEAAPIDRYRETTAALGYTGDSVINSLSDILMMCVGFLIARKLRPWASVALLIVLEIVPLLVIRDNLTLNVWNLLAPNPAVAAWQAREAQYRIGQRQPIERKQRIVAGEAARDADQPPDVPHVAQHGGMPKDARPSGSPRCRRTDRDGARAPARPARSCGRRSPGPGTA